MPRTLLAKVSTGLGLTRLGAWLGHRLLAYITSDSPRHGVPEQAEHARRAVYGRTAASQSPRGRDRF
jgi:hypothetical protein